MYEQTRRSGCIRPACYLHRAAMPNADPPAESRDSSERPRATFRQVLGAVLWSFFGVRKGDAMARDTASIRLWQVILVGVGLAALLVFGLLALVRVITSGTP
jgi:hypothetical protein